MEQNHIHAGRMRYVYGRKNIYLEIPLYWNKYIFIKEKCIPKTSWTNTTYVKILKMGISTWKSKEVCMVSHNQVC